MSDEAAASPSIGSRLLALAARALVGLVQLLPRQTALDIAGRAGRGLRPPGRTAHLGRQGESPHRLSRVDRGAAAQRARRVLREPRAELRRARPSESRGCGGATTTGERRGPRTPGGGSRGVEDRRRHRAHRSLRFLGAPGCGDGRPRPARHPGPAHPGQSHDRRAGELPAGSGRIGALRPRLRRPLCASRAAGRARSSP